MRKITDIYREYKIMPFLQIHQLRVAAVAMQICESLDVEIDTENIIKACLLHDMANIIKFNLAYFPEQNEPEGLEYWQTVQNQFIEKYGANEHLAHVKVAKELNMPESVWSRIATIDSLEHAEENKNSNDWGRKICCYADNRVSPKQIVSLDGRFAEAKERYKNHQSKVDENHRLQTLENLKDIERQTFSHSSIKPEDITNESIEKYINRLKDFEI